MVSIKITTTIDLDVKTTFDLLGSVHKKTYRDAIEAGAISIISEVDPEKALEMRLSRQEQEIAETRQALAQVRLSKQIEKESAKKESEETSAIDQLREEKYQEYRISLANQVNRKTIDWKRIQGIFDFKTGLETEEYILERLRNDQLINCEHCRRWKADDQYCIYSKQIKAATSTCKNWKQR